MKKNIYIVQLGVGGVGRALIQQVIDNRERHLNQLGIRLKHIALTDSSGLAFNSAGFSDVELGQMIEVKSNQGRISEKSWGEKWDGTVDFVDRIESEHVIVVDVTASDGTIPILREVRARDWGIVLANKLPLAASLKVFQELTSSRKTKYETTVAAALPIISTLQSYLLDTGDPVQSLRGCVSGTLNIICQRLEAGEKFSEIIRDCKAHGHTEPDPREDIGGRDSARKALILARLLDYPIEFWDVEAESLYPSEWDSLTVGQFMERLPELDEQYAALSNQTASEKKNLRYLIEVADGRCSAALKSLSPDDDIIRKSLADSVVAFTSERYSEHPMLIRGRGSGPRLTASGVLADVLQIAQMM